MEVNQSAEVLPTVLIIGKNIGEALTLTKSIYLRSLTPTNEKFHDSLCQKALDIKIEAPFASEQYEIDTNYYSCNVRIAYLTYDYLLPLLDSKDLEQVLADHGISSVEGVLFASNFKSQQREGLDQYLKYHKEIIDAFSPELTMTFANTLPNKGEELFEIFKFGENELFVEVIDDDLDEIKPVKPDLSVPKPKFEDKFGVDRIVENLECHIWPNMNRKEVKKRVIPESKEDEGSEDDEIKVEKENSKEPAPAQQEQKPVKEEFIVQEKKAEVVTESIAEAEKRKKEGEALIQQLSKNIGGAGTKDNEGEFEDDDDDGDMEGLAKVFETIQQFKMSSKNLTDEERKQRAADLITQLVSNCKDLQDDDDDSDNEATS